MPLDLTQKLSEHFTLGELLASPTATANGYTEQFEPTEQIVANLTALATNVLEPIRDMVDAAIYDSSGYRCPRLNTKVGGEPNSQHLCEGGDAAADISASGYSVKALYDKIKASNIPFDELIIEHDMYGNYWVHVSWTRNADPRGICMIGTLLPTGGTSCVADGFGAFKNSA